MTRRQERDAELRWLWWRHRRGYPEAREQLILAYTPLVGLTQKRMVSQVPVRIAVEDLLQEGRKALVLCVDRFDPERRVKFESYAIATIRGAMQEYLRREDWVPRSVRTKQKLLHYATEALEAQGRPVTDNSLAEWFGWDLDQAAKYRRAAQLHELVSLEQTKFDGEFGEDADPITITATVAADLDVAEAGIGHIQDEQLRRYVTRLPPWEQAIIRGYYFEQTTLKDIARKLERSQSRVHQLHWEALERLRGFLAEPGNCLAEGGVR